MSLVLVNVLLAVVTLIALAIALWVVNSWRKSSLIGALASLMVRRQQRAHVHRREQHYRYSVHVPDVGDYSAEEWMFSRAGIEKRLGKVKFAFRVLNIATTVIALIPLGFATYNLVTNNQTQALTFNLVSLATVLVTKGGLFLLTLVLIPLFKAVPAGMGTTFGGIIAHKLWKRVEARRKPKPSE